MSDNARQDKVTRAARRAVLVEGTPVLVLGGAALMLGSTPDASPSQQVGWLVATALFVAAVVWVVYRAFGRADEYQRKVQLESMAVGFAAVLVGLQVAVALDAADVVPLPRLAQSLVVGGIAIWLVVADLRTRLQR
jgi:hypothetical protein